MYLQPPAYGEVLAVSEKHLLDSITGAAVEKTESEGHPLQTNRGFPSPEKVST